MPAAINTSSQSVRNSSRLVPSAWPKVKAAKRRVSRNVSTRGDSTGTSRSRFVFDVYHRTCSRTRFPIAFHVLASELQHLAAAQAAVDGAVQAAQHHATVLEGVAGGDQRGLFAVVQAARSRRRGIVFLESAGMERAVIERRRPSSASSARAKVISAAQRARQRFAVWPDVSS